MSRDLSMFEVEVNLKSTHLKLLVSEGTLATNFLEPKEAFITVVLFYYFDL